MNRLLILDSNRMDRKYIDMLSERSDLFEVISVTSIEEAIATLDSGRISVLVINQLDNLNIDGLEILAYVTRNYPSLPSVVMTSYGKPWFKDFERKRAIYTLNEPIEEGSLITAVLVALEMRDQQVVSDCMTVSSILPLIEMEQRTCGLTVEKRNREKGFLYFDKGELIGAFCKNNNGEKAAHEIAGWNKVKLGIGKLRRRKRLKHFNIDLMDLAGAEWFHERLESAPAGVTAPEAVALHPDTIEKELEYCFFGDASETEPHSPRSNTAGGVFPNPA